MESRVRDARIASVFVHHCSNESAAIESIAFECHTTMMSMAFDNRGLKSIHSQWNRDAFDQIFFVDDSN